MNFFFTDAPRNIEDVDKMMRAMNYLADKLGEEKAKQVEADPHEFYNMQKFRKYQSLAYHRAIPFSILATLTGVIGVGGVHNTNHILRTKFPIV